MGRPKRSRLTDLISRYATDSFTDPEGQQVKAWSRLRGGAEARYESGTFGLEGLRAVEWLLGRTDHEVRALVVAQAEVARRGRQVAGRIARLVEAAAERGIRIASVNREVFRRLADTNKPRGVMAIVALPVTSAPSLLDQLAEGGGVALGAVDLNDPGNLGTLVRSAVAFGACGLFALGRSVDPYHPKVLRASAGHLVPAVRTDWREFRDGCSARGIILIGLDADAETTIDGLPPSDRPAVICVGSEGAGLGDRAGECDHRVRIPIAPPAESLNAGVAGSLALWRLTRSPE